LVRSSHRTAVNDYVVGLVVAQRVGDSRGLLVPGPTHLTMPTWKRSGKLLPKASTCLSAAAGETPAWAIPFLGGRTRKSSVVRFEVFWDGGAGIGRARIDHDFARKPSPSARAGAFAMMAGAYPGWSLYKSFLGFEWLSSGASTAL
jgi:hypothetical protein